MKIANFDSSRLQFSVNQTVY